MGACKKPELCAVVISDKVLLHVLGFFAFYVGLATPSGADKIGGFFKVELRDTQHLQPGVPRLHVQLRLSLSSSGFFSHLEDKFHALEEQCLMYLVLRRLVKCHEFVVLLTSDQNNYSNSVKAIY